MNPKTSTVSALTTSEYRYCASSGVSPFKPWNEVRPLPPSTPLSATAAISPSVRSINSARCAGSLAIPSVASTSAASSSSQRRSVLVISCSSPLNRRRVSDGSGGIDRPTSTTWSHRGLSRHSSSRSPVATGSVISSTPSHTMTVGRSTSASEGTHPAVGRRVVGPPGAGPVGEQAGPQAVRPVVAAVEREHTTSTELSGPTARRPWSCRSRRAPTRASPGRPGTRQAPVRRRRRTSCRGGAGICQCLAPGRTSFIGPANPTVAEVYDGAQRS